jgi:tetratricopeptide (TPR) repeat protein
VHCQRTLATLAATFFGAGALPGEDCPAIVARARQAYESRKFDLSISGFERALNVCPQRARILQELAQAQLMAQRFEASVDSLRRLTKLAPDNAMAHKLLGDALYLWGKETEAEQSLRTALTVDPKFEPALYALGRIYYQQNRFPEAVEQFQKVIDLDPKNYRAHDNLGLCYDAMSRDADALRHFLKALDLVHKDHPEYDWAYANLANFFLKRDQYEKAFQFAAEAAGRNPASARNFFLTGKALVELNKQELSLKWLERAVTLDPDYREAHYLLARTYQKLSRQGDAEKELAKFRDLSKAPVNRR